MLDEQQWQQQKKYFKNTREKNIAVASSDKHTCTKNDRSLSKTRDDPEHIISK